jgi:hypothetical protein
MNTPATTPSISSLRRRAGKIGLRVEKSRLRSVTARNLGGYQVIDIQRNLVIDGARYELELADVEACIERLEADQ